MQDFKSVQVVSTEIKISFEIKIWAEITKNWDFFIENLHNSAPRMCCQIRTYGNTASSLAL